MKNMSEIPVLPYMEPELAKKCRENLRHSDQHIKLEFGTEFYYISIIILDIN